MENENPLSFEHKLAEKQKKELELNRRLEAIRIETYNKIKNNPEVLQFLEPYNSFFYDTFLQIYASSKSQWTGLKDYYKERQVKNELEIQEIARKAFECLMKKKMLDIRREWGAGSIELPGISTAFDFMLLVDNVFTVEWIPPIDETELGILLDYVEKYDGRFDLDFWFGNEAENFAIPLLLSDTEPSFMKESFAAFHNENSGAGRLAVLPDKRGQKAMDYLKLYYKKQKEETDAKIASGELLAEKELDMRPFPPTEKPWFIESFIRKFDDRETLQNYKTYREYYHIHDEEEGEDGLTVSEKVETVIARLSHIHVQLPVSANADWRLALLESWDVFRRKTIGEGIALAYEDYLFHVQTGISYQTSESKPAKIKTVNDLKEKFLEGREIAGAPRDFDI